MKNKAVKTVHLFTTFGPGHKELGLKLGVVNLKKRKPENMKIQKNKL